MSRAVRLWIAVLAGPVVWFASMLANFGFTGQICAHGRAVLFAVTALALVLTASAGFSAWRFWREAGVELPGESGGLTACHRSMGLAGVLLSAMFFVVIVAQSVPNLMLKGCE